ncbi:MAG: aspartate aminotransferase family protein [Chloroflexi bacterium]|nr:aspartate aminotransferase family protein [Chloroflexota bacterium]
MNDAVTSTAAAIEDRFTSGAYTKRPLTLVRGQGSTVWDDAGSTYLDLTSGQGVALLGHAHPAVASAVSDQASTLITCAEAFYNDRRAELYALLNDVLNDDTADAAGDWRFFLCNSGAEANEAALKAARLLTGRSGIVAAKRGFHGRTLGALGATFNPDYRSPFAGWTPDVTHIAYNDVAAADAAITDQTAAVLIEAVQGEGGVHLADAEWLRTIRHLCTERGALLIVDEVQSGLGRCGRWFAYQHADITPDVVTLGKGIAGGVPMGAAAWRAELGTIPSATHGSTFGGNPLACAAATAAIGALREIEAPARADRLGAWAREWLTARDIPGVREVRGAGLMIGIELRTRVTPVLQALQARGVLALPAGKTVLRLLPPLVIDQSELEFALAQVEAVLRELA